MGITYELAGGAEFALEASRILEEAWTPPALRYTPEYLRWQLSFPGPVSLPAAVAFDGNNAVGFAGASYRRVRCGSTGYEAAIVSFVAVRPAWRNQGVARGLYRHLLAAVKEIGSPVVTYAAAGSSAERLLLRAYTEAGLEIRPLGAYPVYTFMARGDPPSSRWQAAVPADPASLPFNAMVEECAADTGILWSDPGAEQIRHYMEDPRPRRLIALTDPERGPIGAAWAVRTEFRTPRGSDAVTALESVLLPRSLPGALPVVLRCAAAAWPGGQLAVVTAPSLHGFDANELRRSGIRQTGSPFRGYLCAPGGSPILSSVQGTSLEVI